MIAWRVGDQGPGDQRPTVGGDGCPTDSDLSAAQRAGARRHYLRVGVRVRRRGSNRLGAAHDQTVRPPECVDRFPAGWERPERVGVVGSRPVAAAIGTVCLSVASPLAARAGQRREAARLQADYPCPRHQGSPGEGVPGFTR